MGQIPCLEEMLDRMIAVLPDKPDQAFRFLDLGGGAGTVSERLLTKFTETDCTLIEATEAERDQAGERLVTFGDRVTIIDGDFARVELPRDFDLVVSLGRFHGLGDIERRAVYRADRVPARGVRALRSTRLPAGRAGTFRLPRWAA